MRLAGLKLRELGSTLGRKLLFRGLETGARALYGLISKSRGETMAERIEDLERRIRQLETAIEDIKEISRGRNELGSPRKPIRALYLLDEDTGAVAKVNYSRSASDLQTEEK